MSKDTTGRESGGMESELKRQTDLLRGAEAIVGEAQAYRADVECSENTDSLNLRLGILMDAIQRQRVLLAQDPDDDGVFLGTRRLPAKIKGYPIR